MYHAECAQQQPVVITRTNESTMAQGHPTEAPRRSIIKEKPQQGTDHSQPDSVTDTTFDNESNSDVTPREATELANDERLALNKRLPMAEVLMASTNKVNDDDLGKEPIKNQTPRKIMRCGVCDCGLWIYCCQIHCPFDSQRRSQEFPQRHINWIR